MGDRLSSKNRMPDGCSKFTSSSTGAFVTKLSLLQQNAADLNRVLLVVFPAYPSPSPHLLWGLTLAPLLISSIPSVARREFVEHFFEFQSFEQGLIFGILGKDLDILIR